MIHPDTAIGTEVFTKTYYNSVTKIRISLITDTKVAYRNGDSIEVVGIANCYLTEIEVWDAMVLEAFKQVNVFSSQAAEFTKKANDLRKKENDRSRCETVGGVQSSNS